MPSPAEGNRAFIPVLLTALTALIAYLQFERPLTSARPRSEAAVSVVEVGDQSLVARLWQDPFEGISAAPRPVRAEEMRKQVERRLKDQGGDFGEVTIIGVMVEGANYSEDIETRLRLRYATQLALLGSDDFRPEDRGHLGVLELPWPRGKTLAEPAAHVAWTQDPKRQIQDTNSLRETFPMRVPFEWFSGTGRDGAMGASAVLVLWLDETLFADFPITRLFLLDALALGGADHDTVRFCLLGPRSSNTLASLARRLPIGWHDIPRFAGWYSRVEIWSPEATAPDVFLYPREEGASSTREFTISQCIGPGVAPRLGTFMNLIRTDAELARILARELRLRGLKAGARLVFVSELDTLYGRSLPVCMSAAWRVAGGDDSPAEFETALREELAAGHSGEASRISRFGYLRGLDGLKTRLSSGKEADAKAGGDSGGARWSSEGDSQLDYARRLAERIRSETGEEPRAIGVLGSDIYDKLILLQALKGAFPEALFFTTDIDARYADPSSHPQADNLIVASAWGLEPLGGMPGSSAAEAAPGGSRGARLAPFRDAYQTAVYHGCRALLKRATNVVLPAPRIFEVGRNSLVTLGPKGENQSYGTLVVTSVVLAILVTLVLMPSEWIYRVYLWAVEWAAGGREIRRRRQAVADPDFDAIHWAELKSVGAWVLAGAVLTSVVLAGARYFAVRTEAEPVWLNSGVSAWPTVVIRIWALVMSGAFLHRAWHAHRRHRRELWGAFFGDSASLTDRSWLRNLERWEDGGSPRAKNGADPSSHPPPGNRPEPGYFQRLARTAARTFPWWLGKLRDPRSVSRLSIGIWREEPLGVSSSPTDDRNEVNPRAVFRRYVSLGMLRKRFLRSALATVVYGVIAYGIVKIFEGSIPHPPLRGPAWMFTFERGVLYLSCAMCLLLTWYVFDAVHLSARMIRVMSAGKTAWPERVLKQHSEHRGIEVDHLDGWVDVEFVGRQTNDVYRMVFWPIMVLFVLVVARARVFDHWTWPPSLIVVFLASGVVSVFPVMWIRRSAARIRASALERLRELRNRCAEGARFTVSDARGGQVVIGGKEYRDRLGTLISDIEDARDGALASWFKDYGLIAALLPTGSYGLFEIGRQWLLS